MSRMARRSTLIVFPAIAIVFSASCAAAGTIAGSSSSSADSRSSMRTRSRSGSKPSPIMRARKSGTAGSETWAADGCSAEPVTVEMVVACLQQNAKMAQEIVRRAVGALDADADCPCQHALATAIMTQPAAIKPALKKKLKLLVGKYLK